MPYLIDPGNVWASAKKHHGKYLIVQIFKYMNIIDVRARSAFPSMQPRHEHPVLPRALRLRDKTATKTCFRTRLKGHVHLSALRDGGVRRDVWSLWIFNTRCERSLRPV